MEQIGIISDTHNKLDRTRHAVETLQTMGADAIVHCGDFTNPELAEACAVMPFYFVFGNNDADTVPELEAVATRDDVTCLGWAGEFTASGKRIAVCHGHLTMDLKPLLDSRPNYLLSGHSHIAADWYEGETRRINPGALFRASEYSVAMLDVVENRVEFVDVPR